MARVEDPGSLILPGDTWIDVTRHPGREVTVIHVQLHKVHYEVRGGQHNSKKRETFSRRDWTKNYKLKSRSKRYLKQRRQTR